MNSQQMEDNLFLAKKRKFSETTNCSVNTAVDNCENEYYNDARFSNGVTTARRFIHIQHTDCDTIFQTEDWNTLGSTLFSPLREDLMINTRHIEQFSCSQGNFFVAGHDGVYAKTISDDRHFTNRIILVNILAVKGKNVPLWHLVITLEGVEPTGEVLHLWRFCSQKKKLFISRSFLFKNAQDFYRIQQILQRL